MAKVMTPDVLWFIEECLHEDQLEPNRKQHHTAKRIYDRLVEEQGFKGDESTVRHVVHVLRGNLNEVFVPLVFEPDDAMQIDWGAVEEAFWKGESYFPRHGGIAGSDAAADGPTVDTVDLTRYDSFVMGGEKPCRIPI